MIVLKKIFGSQGERGPATCYKIDGYSIFSVFQTTIKPHCWEFKKSQNRPFYSCGHSALAFDAINWFCWMVLIWEFTRRPDWSGLASRFGQIVNALQQSIVSWSALLRFKQTMWGKFGREGVRWKWKLSATWVCDRDWIGVVLNCTMDMVWVCYRLFF